MATKEYELGPCTITYAGTDLGDTNGGITVTVEESYASLTTDQNGENPVDEVVTGTKVTVAGALAEISLENIASLYKTTVIGTGDSQKVEIKANVGTSLLTNSDVLIVKPYVGGVVSTAKNDWITLGQAGFKATGALTYNSSTQRTLAFTATGYPDASGVIATFGDSAATA